MESSHKVRFGGYECERGAALGLLTRANSRIGKGRLASRSRIDWRNTWCGESVHRSVEREVDVGCEELMLGSNQRPGSSKLVVILGIDDRSEEHTSELQSLMRNSYAVFCFKKKIK